MMGYSSELDISYPVVTDREIVTDSGKTVTVDCDISKPLQKLNIYGTTPALEGINLTDDAEFGTKWTNAIYIEDEKCWQGGAGQLTRVRYDNLPSRICVEFDFRYTTLSAAAAANGIYVAFYYTDGTVNYGRTQRPTEWTRYSFVSTEGKVIDHIGFGYNLNGTYQIRNVMIYEWTESPGGGYIENGRNSGYVKKDSLMLVRHGKNLTPYFAHTLQNPLTTDWYWYSITRDKITFADDGWLHIEADNIEATSTLYIHPYVRAQGFIKNSTVYTCLLEFRNVEYTGTIRFDPSSASVQHPQMHGGFFGYDGSSSHRWVMTSYADAETSSVTLLRFVIGISTGSYFKGDIRLSLYEGEYTGEYQPYYYDTVSIPLNGHTVSEGQSVEVSSDGVVTLDGETLGTVDLPTVYNGDILEVVGNEKPTIETTYIKNIIVEDFSDLSDTYNIEETYTDICDVITEVSYNIVDASKFPEKESGGLAFSRIPGGMHVEGLSNNTWQTVAYSIDCTELIGQRFVLESEFKGDLCYSALQMFDEDGTRIVEYVCGQDYGDLVTKIFEVPENAATMRFAIGCLNTNSNVNTDIYMHVYRTRSANLTPFFANGGLPSASNSYWYSVANNNYTTGLDDGWLHIDVDNTSGSATIYIRPYPRAQTYIKSSTVYTLLLEVRNAEYEGTVRFHPSQATVQIPQIAAPYFDYDGSSSYRWVTESYTTEIPATLVRMVINIFTGSYFKGDIRLSLYEGEYDGSYQPYYIPSAPYSDISDSIEID